MTITATQRSRIDAAFAALSDPTRRAMVELLGRDEHRAGALAEALSLAPPAASKHLRILKDAGLVEERAHADARVRLYSLRHESLAPLRVWLDEVGRFWDAQLGAFAAHAEKRAREKEAAREGTKLPSAAEKTRGVARSGARRASARGAGRS
jgi:DNA-binding transcriptional ArsR family regulator